MTFVRNGNQGPFPLKTAKKHGPNRKGSEHLKHTHDGNDGLDTTEPRQSSPEDVIEGWPRADQL